MLGARAGKAHQPANTGPFCRAESLQLDGEVELSVLAMVTHLLPRATRGFPPPQGLRFPQAPWHPAHALGMDSWTQGWREESRSFTGGELKHSEWLSYIKLGSD